MPKIVFPDSYCMVEGMANWDWDRSQKRHFPDIQNLSTVPLKTLPPPPRELMIDSPYRYEKRHYCISMLRSYLDDFY
ncbi:hypothetical protein Trydic_g151 [Trypoxylus dichotomus]